MKTEFEGRIELSFTEAAELIQRALEHSGQWPKGAKAINSYPTNNADNRLIVKLTVESKP